MLREIIFAKSSHAQKETGLYARFLGKVIFQMTSIQSPNYLLLVQFQVISFNFFKYYQVQSWNRDVISAFSKKVVTFVL